MNSTLDVFLELYELLENKEVVSKLLKEKAINHGIRIEAVKDIVTASLIEGDSDE